MSFVWKRALVFLVVGTLANSSQALVWNPIQDSPSVLPIRLINEALDYLEEHPEDFPNQNYLSVIDFSRHSTEDRFFLIDLESGELQSFLTAHGKGSDTDHDGFAETFSNVPDSKQSSLGFFRSAETYYGSHGYSMRMDGLESSNDRARERYIVIHGAKYVSPFRDPIGRSWGCPALEQGLSAEIIDKIKDGSLIYAGLDENPEPPQNKQ